MLALVADHAPDSVDGFRQTLTDLVDPECPQSLVLAINGHFATFAPTMLELAAALLAELERCPRVAARMPERPARRQRVEEDPADPLYVPPRRTNLRAWECILSALHDTVCYTHGATMTTAEVRDVSAPFFRANNIVWSKQCGISTLKDRGFIEKLRGLIKMTPDGKAACDEILSRV